MSSLLLLLAAFVAITFPQARQTLASNPLLPPAAAFPSYAFPKHNALPKDNASAASARTQQLQAATGLESLGVGLRGMGDGGRGRKEEVPDGGGAHLGARDVPKSLPIKLDYAATTATNTTSTSTGRARRSSGGGVSSSWKDALGVERGRRMGRSLRLARRSPGSKGKSRRLWGDALPLASPPTSDFYQHPSPTTNSGSCHSRKNITIVVTSPSDISLRLKYPTTSFVSLVFQNDITLAATLVLSRNFSCTAFLARSGFTATIHAPWSSTPGIVLFEASNVLFNHISLQFGITSASPPCSYFINIGLEYPDITCAGLYIVRSFGIQVTKGRFYGRIDIMRSWFVRLDSLSATSAPTFRSGRTYRSWQTRGVIRVGESDLAPNFVSSNIVISNCEVYKNYELISIYQGAVGVTVRNNFLHQYEFAAIRCGSGESKAFDCHHNYIANNFIANTNKWLMAKDTDKDSAGIYFSTHWFSPGNFLTCNYVFYSRQCIFFDELSSGINVEGGVCYKSFAGVKVNMGKYNRVRGLINAYGMQYNSVISCIWVRTRWWPRDMYTRYWEGTRRAYYNTAAINNLYPWMKALCNPVPSAINGYACNSPGGYPATQTGKCSGLPYFNSLQTFGIAPSTAINNRGLNVTVYKEYCDMVPNVPRMNTQVWYNVTDPQYTSTFIRAKSRNFGVRRSSPIYKLDPSFKSCNRKATRRLKVRFSTYMGDFNIPKPKFFDNMLNFTIPNPPPQANK